MRILVTGGAGFIGSHLVEKLVSDGHEVVVIDNYATQIEHPIDVPCYVVSILSDQLDHIFEMVRPQVVIHLAAQTNVQLSQLQPIVDGEINIIGTLKILECCRKYRVEKLIFSSTAAVYGEPAYIPLDEEHPVQPVSQYGLSKLTAEKYIELYGDQYGLNYTILRFANVYGPRQSSQGEAGVITIFIDHYLNRQRPTIYGDGRQIRDFIYVEDVTEANVLAINAGDRQVMNVSSSVGTTLLELIEILDQISGINAVPIFGSPRKGDIKKSILDHTRATRLLNWQPKYTMRDGLQETYDYYLGLKSK